jgi:hypothetical protein
MNSLLGFYETGRLIGETNTSYPGLAIVTVLSQASDPDRSQNHD